MIRVMGVDASTTTIGICIVSYDKKRFPTMQLDHIEYYKPPKKGNVFEKLSAVRKFIFERIDTLNPDEIALEEIVLFMQNRSTAKTITSLASLNRTVGVAVLDKTGDSPYMYNVMKIRHSIKNGVLPKKEEIPNRLEKILGTKFPYKINKKGAIAKESYDMSDAVACAICHIKNNHMMTKYKKSSLKRKKKAPKK